jgi:hypothetical protein
MGGEINELLRRYYRSRSIRKRMGEFLGRHDGGNPTAAYIVANDGYSAFGLPASPRFLPRYLDNGLDVARSLWDRESLIADLDLDYENLRIGLVLENMLPHLFAGRIRDLLWILGALDTVEAGICLDTGHAHLGEDVTKVVHKLSGHLWMIHASDNHGHYDDHLPPGDGKIDWAKLLAHLSRQRFTGTIILEIKDLGSRQATLEGARRGRKHLRELSHRLRISG